ncbi:MAG: MerR family DNA-binding protein [Rhodospirillaceae bacterium]|nr:MerR family DNA-binding protein [Rhodospirillaceae bacterium]
MRALLGLAGRHKLACDEVKALTEVHIANVRQKIRDLRRFEHVLSDPAARCRPNKVPECPILETLSE